MASTDCVLNHLKFGAYHITLSCQCRFSLVFSTLWILESFCPSMWRQKWYEPNQMHISHWFNVSAFLEFYVFYMHEIHWLSEAYTFPLVWCIQHKSSYKFSIIAFHLVSFTVASSPVWTVTYSLIWPSFFTLPSSQDHSIGNYLIVERRFLLIYKTHHAFLQNSNIFPDC